MAIVKPFKGVDLLKISLSKLSLVLTMFSILRKHVPRQAITRRAFIILLNLKSISNLVLLSTILAFMKALQRTSESSRRMAG